MVRKKSVFSIFFISRLPLWQTEEEEKKKKEEVILELWNLLMIAIF